MATKKCLDCDATTSSWLPGLSGWRTERGKWYCPQHTEQLSEERRESYSESYGARPDTTSKGGPGDSQDSSKKRAKRALHPGSDPAATAQQAMDKVVYDLMAQAYLMYGPERAEELMQVNIRKLSEMLAAARGVTPLQFDFEAIYEAQEVFGDEEGMKLASRVSVTELRRLVNEEKGNP